MSIDPSNNTLLTLSEASRLLPGRPHKSTILRWGKRGIRSVRLNLVRVGGRWHVSRRALERFIAEVTEAVDPSICNTASDDDGNAAAEGAGRKLDALVFRRATGQKHVKQPSK